MRFRPAALLYFAQRLFCAKGDSSPSASGYLSSHIKGPRPKFPRISSPQMEPERLSDEQHGFCGERNHCPGRMGNRWSGILGASQRPGTPKRTDFRARGRKRPQASTHCQQPEGRSIVCLDRGDRLAERRVSGLPDVRQYRKTYLRKKAASGNTGMELCGCDRAADDGFSIIYPLRLRVTTLLIRCFPIGIPLIPRVGGPLFFTRSEGLLAIVVNEL